MVAQWAGGELGRPRDPSGSAGSLGTMPNPRVDQTCPRCGLVFTVEPATAEDLTFLFVCPRCHVNVEEEPNRPPVTAS